MKKYVLTIITLLTVCFIMCSCNKDENTAKNEIVNDNKFVDGQDYQYQFSDTWVYDDKINKAEEGYYFTKGDFLYFLDEKTMKATPLCNKPDCLHDKETDKEALAKCNAYISAFDANIYYNNGFIYYINRGLDSGEMTTNIVRCSSDGTTKEKLASVKNSRYNILVVHRNYLYYSATEYILTDKKDNTGKTKIDGQTKIYRLALDKNNSEPEVFLENADFGLSGTPIVTKMSAYGNHLIIYTEEADISDNGGSSIVVDNSPIFSVDILTGKVTNISDKVTELGKKEYPQKNILLDEVTYLDDKLLFRFLFLTDNDRTPGNEVYTMNFDGTDIKKVYTIPDGLSDSLYTDENYVYISTLNYDKSGENITGTSLYVYDHSFNLLNTAKLPLPDPLVYYSNDILSSVGDKLITYNTTFELDENGEIKDEDHPIYYIKYIDKKDLLKKDADLQWKTAFESE